MEDEILTLGCAYLKAVSDLARHDAERVEKRKRITRLRRALRSMPEPGDETQLAYEITFAGDHLAGRGDITNHRIAYGSIYGDRGSDTFDLVADPEMKDAR